MQTAFGSREAVLTAANEFYEVQFDKTHSFIAGETYIPAAKQVTFQCDLVGLIETVLNGQYACGPKTKEFERELGAQYFPDRARPILVNSGSSANLIALSALGSSELKRYDLKPLEHGDEVITVAAGFPTTVAPILQNGWVPVFVDVDCQTLNATPDSIANALSSKTRAVILSHTLGNPFQVAEIARWCADHNLFLIEDCCDALGATYQEQPVGTFGDLATLSFYPAHHISMGEGGAVIPRLGQLRKIAVSYRDWGRDCWCEPAHDNTCKKRFCQNQGDLPYGYDHKYIYTHLGYNLKATELQASLGLSQLIHSKLFIAMRRANYKSLASDIRLSPLLHENLFPVIPTKESNPSWFGFPMHCGPKINRRDLIEYLEEHKVGCRLVFGGNLTKQPAFIGKGNISGDLINTDRVMDNTFWIGVHPDIGSVQIDYMLDVLEAGVKAQLK